MDDIHSALEVFETTASQLGLHVSWQKTKIRNLGAAYQYAATRSLEEVTEFTYLGSVQSTTGGCQLLTRHYQAHWHRFYCHALYEKSLATDPRLQLQTKLRL